MFQVLLFAVVHVCIRPLKYAQGLVSNSKTSSLGCVWSSQLWPASSAPSITSSRWRSRTLRCLMRCRWTLWSARTHQVSHSNYVTFNEKRSAESVWMIISALADLSSSPPGPYGQEQYICRPEEHLKAPPILPPHLLQVILNKDTNISVNVSSISPLVWMCLLSSDPILSLSHSHSRSPLLCSVIPPCCLNPIMSCSITFMLSP